MLDWLKRRRAARTLERRAIPDALWRLTLARFPFLAARSADDITQLRDIAPIVEHQQCCHGIFTAQQAACIEQQRVVRYRFVQDWWSLGQRRGPKTVVTLIIAGRAWPRWWSDRARAQLANRRGYHNYG